MAQQKTSFILKGGVDLEAPYQTLPFGALRDAVNYELRPFGGYRRVEGYVKYDGHSPAAAPTGSGAIRGVWIYQGVGYCIRDNAGATAGQLYMATGGGWVAQNLGSYLKFTGGSLQAGGVSYVFGEGQTITGNTSGATGVVARQGLNSGITGAFPAGTLAGTVVLTSVTGTFQNGETLKVGGTSLAVASGVLTANALPVGGDYRFWNYNFLANAQSTRMYGAGGVGPAFEWDGTTFFPIYQQVGSSWPNTIVGHNDHLFLGYETQGILRISSINSPRDFLSTTGAVDVGAGDKIYDMRPVVGGPLAVGCSGSMQLIYGENATNWARKRYNDHGVRKRSMKDIGGTVVLLDSRGVQRMDQTAAFGDFSSTSLSVAVNSRMLPVTQFISAGVAIVSKNKDQYRIFFGRGGYIFTFNAGKMIGVMPVAIAHTMVCACEGEDAAGAEFLLFGTSDGIVMRMDNGAFKHDGTAIQSALTLEFQNFGLPTQNKQFRKLVVYGRTEGVTPMITTRVDFEFNTGSIPATIFQNLVLPGGAGEEWDDGLWDTFEWAGGDQGEASVYLDGTAQHASISFYASGAENGLHQFESGVLHWSPRKVLFN